MPQPSGRFGSFSKFLLMRTTSLSSGWLYLLDNSNTDYQDRGQCYLPMPRLIKITCSGLILDIVRKLNSIIVLYCTGHAVKHAEAFQKSRE